MHIRPVAPTDLDRLYEICLLTGDLGGDGREIHDDPRVLGEVYAAPYAIHQPDHCYVVDDEGRAVGYVLAALDSKAFDETLEKEWWPALRSRYPLNAGGRTRADQDAVNLIHHPYTAVPEFLETHPSHLHIDLLPVAQGQGWGRKLIETVESSLADAGSPGVQLTVSAANARAVSFYRALEFVQLDGHEDLAWVFGHLLPRP